MQVWNGNNNETGSTIVCSDAMKMELLLIFEKIEMEIIQILLLFCKNHLFSFCKKKKLYVYHIYIVCVFNLCSMLITMFWYAYREITY